MARATETIIRPIKTQAQQDAEKLSEVRSQAALDAEGLIEGLKLLQALQERGVLQLVIALFNRGDKVLAKLMDVLGDETATNLLQSGITMMEGLSNIDAKAISRSFNGVKSGLENVGKSPDASEKRKPLGMFALMKQLKDPDVNAAISFGLDFMKGVGHAIRTGDNSPSKNQQ